MRVWSCPKSQSIPSMLAFNGTARLRAAIAQYPAMFLDLAGFAPRPAEVNAALEQAVDGYLARKGVAAAVGLVDGRD